MKSVILIVFLLWTLPSFGQWYYGTGEATNLENIIGFDQDPLAKIEAVNGGINMPDIQSGNVNQRNQFKDPFFFRDASEWECSGASPACELSLTQTNVLEGANSLAFTLEENEFIFANFTLTDAQKKAQLKAAINYVNSSGDLAFIIQRDAAIVEEFDLVASDWTRIGYYITGNDADNITLAIQCNSATCSGLLDDVYFGRFDVPTASFKNCRDDLDCVNEFSAIIDSDGTVISQNAPFIEGDCTNADPRICTFVAGLATQRVACTTDGKESVTSTDTQFSISGNAQATEVNCSKQGDDYKPLTETGVLTKQGSPKLRLFVSNESETSSNQTVGNNTVTVEFGDIHDSNLIEWDTINNEATFLTSGKINLSANLPLLNGDASVDWLIFPEIDKGAGFSMPDTLMPISTRTGFSVAVISTPNIEFSMNVKKGDKVRLRAQSFDSNSLIMDNDTNRYPTMQIRSVVDDEYIQAEIKDTLKYDGAGSMIGGYASFGGATDGSVCSSSPCTRYREVGELGGNMSAIRVGLGLYSLEVSGFKPNSNTYCDCSATEGTESFARSCIISNTFKADSSGVVTIGRIITSDEPYSQTDREDTFFQVHCTGSRP